ncbi:hypothetical protein SAY86_017187 [Trapa natans]|uniref:Uncharacterized protein n=1 Tax=Trapa natans TaxID=22666 RepID=A0AAN7LK82_TRANT|nr:hypothetical protein SAY86_017187 [Trapa natans]
MVKGIKLYLVLVPKFQLKSITGGFCRGSVTSSRIIKRLAFVKVIVVELNRALPVPGADVVAVPAKQLSRMGDIG